MELRGSKGKELPRRGGRGGLRQWKVTALVVDSPLFDSCSPGYRHNKPGASAMQLESTAPFYKDINLKMKKHTAPVFTSTRSWKQLKAPHSHRQKDLCTTLHLTLCNCPTGGWKLTSAEHKGISAPHTISEHHRPTFPKFCRGPTGRWEAPCNWGSSTAPPNINITHHFLCNHHGPTGRSLQLRTKGLLHHPSTLHYSLTGSWELITVMNKGNTAPPIISILHHRTSPQLRTKGSPLHSPSPHPIPGLQAPTTFVFYHLCILIVLQVERSHGQKQPSHHPPSLHLSISAALYLYTRP